MSNPIETGTFYFWDILMASGRVLTIKTHRPIPPGICAQIREEVGDFLDARVEDLSTYQTLRTPENISYV